MSSHLREKRALIILFLPSLLQASCEELSTEEEGGGGLSVSIKLYSFSSRVTGISQIDY